MFESKLQTIKKSDIRDDRFLAFDVENNPYPDAEENFLCASVYGQIRINTTGNIRKDVFVQKTFLSQKEMHDWILNLPKDRKSKFVFFNLNYDKPYFNEILNHAETIYVNGNCLTFETINGYKAYDISRHVSGTLDNWIKQLDLKDCSKVDYEIGVLSDAMIKHCENDVKATWHLAEFVKNFYKKYGVTMGLTLPATALKIFKKNYLHGKKFKQTYVNPDGQLNRIGKLEKEAYYGGRTEVFKRTAGVPETHFSYDINSAYLSAMRDEFFPDLGKWAYREFNRDDLGSGNLYIVDATVKISEDMYLPPLPYRKDGKLIFPTGQFRGVWTSVDFEQALAVGTQIVKIHQGIAYEKKIPLFKEYADDVWKARAEYKAEGNKGMDTMTKLMGNSLYGKFAQMNPAIDYFGDMEGLKILTKKVNDKYGLNLKIGKEVVVTASRHNDKYMSAATNIKLPAKHFFPSISAFITAYCRRKLYRAMLANQDSLAYVDTDCIKLKGSEAKGIEISKELGAWGFEGEFKLEIFNAKFYTGKHKGVPKNHTVLKNSEELTEFEFYRPNKERESLRSVSDKEVNKWDRVVKIVGKKDDKRVWYKKETESKPIIVYE